MPDRLRRNCARAESWLCSARIRGPDLIQADLLHARAAHIFAMYRVDTSNRDSTAVIRRAPDASQDGTEVRADMSSQRSGVLELAVLGLLHETPMHGYELRKRLNSLLGAFRAFGYGSLYPCLKELLARGLIADDTPAATAAKPLAGRRSKIVYRLTADGKERLQDLLSQTGPAAWEDDGFGVRFAFFGQTRADIRLRILEGRRSRLEERAAGLVRRPRPQPGTQQKIRSRSSWVRYG